MQDSDLQDAVELLTQEVRVLRQAIDEFREDFIHMLRKLPENLPPPYAHLRTLAESFSMECPTTDEPSLCEQPASVQPTTTAVRAPRRTSLFD